jgi:hypothetical protein
MKLDMITNVEVIDVDWEDYPDFTDAWITSADLNGVPMTEGEIEELNQDDTQRYDLIIKNLF